MRRLTRLCAALLVCLCLGGCGAGGAHPKASAPPAASAAPGAAAPGPLVRKGEEITLALLSGFAWTDAYDPNITLAFDASGSMTETDANLKTATARSVRVENGELVLLNALGLPGERWPVWLGDGLLCMDAGDPVGELAYRPAPLENGSRAAGRGLSEQEMKSRKPGAFFGFGPGDRA